MGGTGSGLPGEGVRWVLSPTDFVASFFPLPLPQSGNFVLMLSLGSDLCRDKCHLTGNWEFRQGRGSPGSKYLLYPVWKAERSSKWEE